LTKRLLASAVRSLDDMPAYCEMPQSAEREVLEGGNWNGEGEGV
jgi:hypothetical protein